MRAFGAGFLGVLYGTAMWLPAALGLITIILYLSSGELPGARASLQDNAVLLAVVVVLVAWILFAWAAGRSALPRNASSHSFADVNGKAMHLRSVLDAESRRFSSKDAAGDSAELSQERQAYREAEDALRLVGEELASHSPWDTKWTSASGYVDALRLVHRAEGAALMFASLGYVVRVATEDIARLDGSDIPDRTSLLAQLKLGLRRVSPEVAAALEGLGAETRVAIASATVSPEDDMVGRAMLRQVHQAVDAYRDGRRDGIVRARNRLTITSLTFGFALYAILALAISKRAPAEAIAAGVAFFLVGAVVGLFAQLRKDAAEDSAVEDYGLSIVRIAQTPLSSGFAAVAGVVMLPIVYAFSIQNGLSAVIPQQAPTLATGASAAISPAQTLLDLKILFNITQFPYGLLVAAIFGLSPGLLIDRLAKQAEEYKKDLRSSSAA